jgi:transcriptional regulator with XRE-family HTH domain
MKLKDYLKIHNLSFRDFEKISGINHQTLHHYVHKIHKPSLQNAQKIFKATKGAVTLEDLEN